MRVSKYKATSGEANFGRPIQWQVDGGTHITFEMLTKRGSEFFMTRWPEGLPGHDDPPNSLRFPHGLIRVGESLDACAKRLVRDQLGMGVANVRLAYWDSYLDEHGHWHVEPGCIVEVKGTPKVPAGAAEILRFTLDKIPQMTFWPKADFMEIVNEHLLELLE